MRALLVLALTACGAYAPRNVKVERYEAVCYAADPTVILRAVGDILRAHGYATNANVPGRWLWATRGETYVGVRLKETPHCSRIDLFGGFPWDPHRSAVPDFQYFSRYFHPLIRRRLARVADGRPLRWQRPLVMTATGGPCRTNVLRCH
jgi:hypothetical protein